MRNKLDQKNLAEAELLLVLRYRFVLFVKAGKRACIRAIRGVILIVIFCSWLLS